MRAEIQVVFVPVSDADRAKAFYADGLGWTVDHDQTVSPELRFVQVTPPGSACSIAFGPGISPMTPGALDAVMLVVDDAEALHAELVAAGLEPTAVDDQAWGRFVTLQDPDGNRLTFQELPARS